MKYEAIGCGVYEVDPPDKAGDSTVRVVASVTAGNELLATHIADALNGSEALLTALENIAEAATDRTYVGRTARAAIAAATTAGVTG